MAKLNYDQMVAGLNDLTRDELIELNKILCVVARNKGRENRMDMAAAVIGNFRTGDIIKFEKSGRGKQAGVHYFKYEHLNRNGDCMQGQECDEHGIPFPHKSKWTVGLTQPSVAVHMRGGKLFKAAA